MRLTALATLFVLATIPAPVRAAESFDNCTGYVDALPAVISTQGVWCLRKDLATAIDSGAAITIAAHNVTLDCNGYKIGGLAAGPGTTAYGIRAQDRVNTTVRDCLLRGFGNGIYLESDGALIEGVVSEGSKYRGILLVGFGGVVRDNRVFDTGKASGLGSATGIHVQGDNDVLDNRVNGVVDGYATGISVHLGPGATIQRNSVRAIVGGQLGRGVSSQDSPGALVRENALMGPGTLGIQCDAAGAIAMGNAISAFTDGVDPNCRSSGNLVD